MTQCEKCEHTKNLISMAKLACRISGRLDIVKVLTDIEELSDSVYPPE